MRETAPIPKKKRHKNLKPLTINHAKAIQAGFIPKKVEQARSPVMDSLSDYDNPEDPNASPCRLPSTYFLMLDGTSRAGSFNSY